MITLYALCKLAHLVAVVAFLGNVSLGLFWVAHAESSRNPAIVAHAMRGIVRSDRWLTVPGVIAVSVAGVATALVGGLKLLSVGWILGSILLFLLSGLVFGLVLAPLQRRIIDLASAADDMQVLLAPLRRWHRFGWVSVLPLWGALAMMTLKWPG